MDLMALMDRNETLFYRFLVDHIEELMPIVYTPTVGEACQKFGDIFRSARGQYITTAHAGRVRQVLDNWPTDDVAVIVVTDGERILGLGDLGSGGMGIGIGKLSLYVAAGGIHPSRVLPICLDVGTDNESLRDDPKYLGVRAPRTRGDAYVALVDEFMAAVAERFPGALVQFEDFATPNAIAHLERYRDRYRCFNDDIQGTAAVAAAGVISAACRSGRKLADLHFVMAGAGGAAVGIADLLVEAMVADGLETDDARHRFWFTDSRGLIHAGRGELPDHKARYARDAADAEAVAGSGGEVDLLSVVRHVGAPVLIGASGSPGLFTEEIVRAHADGADDPVVFMLSNPTSKAECTPQQAIEWSDGRVVVATGSPFAPVQYRGETIRIGQANNVFIFPGLGLGVLAARASRIPEALFLTAMRALGELAPADALYPSIAGIRDVSRGVAYAVARHAIRDGLGDETDPDQAEALVDALIWRPEYLPARAV